MTLFVPKIMSELAIKRPVFHSEADFQFAFAWELSEQIPESSPRLEYPLSLEKRMRLDIFAPRIGVAIELKYATKKKTIVHEGETFLLKDQSAQDLKRYDFLKDIERLERIGSKRDDVTEGRAIFVTNDPAYWSEPKRSRANDWEFRIHEGADLCGERKWSESAGAGTTKERTDPIRLRGSYKLEWRHYSSFGNGSGDTFRYLLVDVW